MDYHVVVFRNDRARLVLSVGGVLFTTETSFRHDLPQAAQVAIIGGISPESASLDHGYCRARHVAAYVKRIGAIRGTAFHTYPYDHLSKPVMDPLDSTNSKATARSSPHGIAADLIAVLVAVTSGEPRVLTIQDQRALPSGPFELSHRSLQSGLRAWVERQTRLPLGYVEQLYTFADRDRAGATAQHVISISYLGLTREQPASGEYEASWPSWYDYFPWEDHRLGPPPLIKQTLQPGLATWASATRDRPAQRSRRQRAAALFGFEDHVWNEELVLQRYELLYEARLIPEALRGNSSTAGSDNAALSATSGKSMILDHRRILATGIARLRAKIKYHPVVFELMPDEFTLLQLQRCVEALAGKLVHKPNFRRLIEQQDLVEETGDTSQETGGRPAKLFRFRRAIFAERAIAGTKLPVTGA